LDTITQRPSQIQICRRNYAGMQQCNLPTRSAVPCRRRPPESSTKSPRISQLPPKPTVGPRERALILRFP
jgi:hypothetical protein